MVVGGRELVRQADGQEPLTRRENDVLRLLPTRLSNAQIAAQLGISENTVKTHLKGIYRKLRAPNRNGAIEAAVACGLLADWASTSGPGVRLEHRQRE